MGISVSGADVAFTTTAGSEAVARSTVTSSAPTSEVTFSFEVTRRPLKMRAGTTAGGQEIFTDLTLYPGQHLITFTPGVSPYYIEFRLPDTGYVGAAEGKSNLLGFTSLPAGDLTLETPWQEDTLRSLRMEQSFDVAWITTKAVQTRVLERRGSKSWSLRKYQPENGPFSNLNITTTTMVCNTNTGAGTLTASAPIFRATHAGALVKITHQGQYITSSIDALSEYSTSAKVTGASTNRNLQLTITGVFTGTLVLQRSIGSELNWVTYQTHTGTTDTQYNDALDNQIIYYRVLATAWTSGTATIVLQHANGSTDGIVRIHSVEADNSATVDVLTPVGKTTATTDWAFSAWSDASGWPAAIALSDGRLWAGRDDRFWASDSDDFESFEIGADDANAFTRRVTGGWGSVRSMLGVDKMVICMDAREAEVSSNTQDDILTPTNAASRPRSRRGSANAQAIAVDADAAFIDRSTRKLFRMTSDGNKYELNELTRLHRTIAGGEGTTDGFLECAVQYNPEPRIWLPCTDGRMAVLLYEPIEGVVAWCRLVDTGAYYESVCCLPGDVEDSVYFIVRRTVNGSTVRHVEKLAAEAWENMEDVWRLRGAVVYSGSATTAITGLSHLEGRTVYSWTDGYQQGPYTVASGAITLDYAASYAITGLLYEGKYKSPRVMGGASMGTAMTQDRKVTRIGLLPYRTAPGALKWGRDFTNMETIKGDDPVTFDAAMVEITDDINKPFAGATSKDPRVCLSMPTAGPATVLGLVPHLETNEKSA